MNNSLTYGCTPTLRQPPYAPMPFPSPVAHTEASLPTDSSTAIAVDNLSKRFGPFWALRGASFSIRGGEILGLIGPNGSGKTTLFECLAGVLPATLGSISRGGMPIPPPQRKRALYFVPDGIRPWPDQTVSWVLRFCAGLYGATLADVDDVVRSVGLEPLRGARLHELSKGEHRRVLLAFGLLTPQPLLMLDEPFDGLDLRQTRDVMAVLRGAAARGRTLFLSIHQLGDAARICDRLVLLSSGKVVGEGTLDELRSKAGLGEGGLEEVFLALT
jgi:ABC-2 type transport system ATP-binding protein